MTAETHRIIVCGSRSWTARAVIADRLRRLDPSAVVVHGDCPNGADRIVDQEARWALLAVERHKADWERHGKAAGFIRNEEMAELGAALCIAFWDGRSRGTADMVQRAEAHDIPTEIVRPAADRAYDEMQWRGWDE